MASTPSAEASSTAARTLPRGDGVSGSRRARLGRADGRDDTAGEESATGEEVDVGEERATGEDVDVGEESVIDLGDESSGSARSRGCRIPTMFTRWRRCQSVRLCWPRWLWRRGYRCSG